MQRLLALNVAEFNLVHQSDFGMEARKPTHFGSRRMSTYNDQRRLFRAPVDPARIELLVGRNEEGFFKMAIAKEYQSPLCRSIAYAFGDFGHLAEIVMFCRLRLSLLFLSNS